MAIESAPGEATTAPATAISDADDAANDAANNAATQQALARLENWFQSSPGVAIAVAVSGGVDSMTLATVAHRMLGAAGRCDIFHASSAAVPAQATERVRDESARQGWALQVIDAGEFADPRYIENPVNRCFYCKSSLYRAVSRATASLVVSGANKDDLGEYRPGLDAAKDFAVRHPYVELGIDKNMVRALARYLGLPTLAALPASPCLSSRIETGIPIAAPTLLAVHTVERRVIALLDPLTARCRVRAAVIEIELDRGALDRLLLPAAQSVRAELEREISDAFNEAGVSKPIVFNVYRNGSAFIGIKRLPGENAANAQNAGAKEIHGDRLQA